MLVNETIDKVKPFLRWAGGKTWLIKHIPQILKNINYNNYHEPFLGGASIFYHLNNGRNSYLSDINPKLIETYECVKLDVEKVISYLEQFKNTEQDYYRVRKQKYSCAFQRAARFIYLNQTSFNGIYRENFKGEYNVPYGHRTKEFLEPKNLILASHSFNKTTFITQDFSKVIDRVNQQDLVFLDPPYTVSHNKNGFIKYNKNLFSLDDQYRLKDTIAEINNRGAYYILTNAAHSKIDDIFSINNTKLELPRASLIGGINAKRGHVSEFIFTNII